MTSGVRPSIYFMKGLLPLFIILTWVGPLQIRGQEALVFGVLTDLISGLPVDYATIHIENTAIAVDSDEFGHYRLVVPSKINLKLVYTRIGYERITIQVEALPDEGKRNINIKLSPLTEDLGITIRSSRIEDVGMVREEVTEMFMIPSTTGNLESVLPSIALGVSSGGGELSSQYNVRGGNYDENLIYVNDFEIFRPQLIRSGQQEGLTFPNMDMIRDLSFSSGGFEAMYGDRMSSVLDVRYKRPEELRGSISGSLLGASTHLEGSKRLGPNAYNKLRFLTGARYKTNRYLLGTLDTQGEYVPDFIDLQAYLTYDISRSLQAGLIGNYNISRYNFIPRERESAFGLVNFALRLSAVFEGSEVDDFINGMSGISLTYLPEKRKNPMFVKLLASGYRGRESEQFDILGYYRLAQIETQLGSENVGQEVAVLGTGIQHLNARNYLYNEIYNIRIKGGIEFNLEDGSSHFFQWGAKYQHEYFDDSVREWERLDSAGYSLPFNEYEVLVNSFIRSENEIVNQRLSAYAQNTYTSKIPGKRELRIIGGMRMKYSSLNDEVIISPRMQILFKPLNWAEGFSFKLAGGIYYQPPFYREMRRLDGSLNTSLRSQRSIHLVSGFTYDFMWTGMSQKPFRIISELYYKKLDNLTIFDIDNVKIRYSGENDASGYAMGFDFRINGEFVPGAESWINLSFLKTHESIQGVQHMRRKVGEAESEEVNSVPRPTDRFFNMSMFFQDYLPRNENFRVNLNLSFGSGLPFGLRENNIIFRNNFRFKPYHRIDIGFGYKLSGNKKDQGQRDKLWGISRDAWLSLEVFNLMDVANEVANTWIKTVTNVQYAIPNYLTSRRINLRFRVDL